MSLITPFANLEASSFAKFVHSSRPLRQGLGCSVSNSSIVFCTPHKRWLTFGPWSLTNKEPFPTPSLRTATRLFSRENGTVHIGTLLVSTSLHDVESTRWEDATCQCFLSRFAEVAHQHLRGRFVSTLVPSFHGAGSKRSINTMLKPVYNFL